METKTTLEIGTRVTILANGAFKGSPYPVGVVADAGENQDIFDRFGTVPVIFEGHNGLHPFFPNDLAAA